MQRRDFVFNTVIPLAISGLVLAGCSTDINSANAPIVAFVVTNASLMANLTLEGTKITRIKG